jgi:predicted AAA+ superfamily ATPase
VRVYATPDQDRYLHIVESIARRRGVDLEWEELRARALRWAEWHNGRSGRTARQFVDSLAAR